MKFRIAYWCNLNVRDKYFDGYKPSDKLVYVGEIEAFGPEDAYQKFNRIDEPVPVLDEAEAPSMSVGDVIHVIAWSKQDVNGNYGDWVEPAVDPEGKTVGPWLTVARAGFTGISAPHSDTLYLRVRGESVSDVIHGKIG